MRKFSLFLNLRKITCVKQSLTASVHTKRSLARTGAVLSHEIEHATNPLDREALIENKDITTKQHKVADSKGNQTASEFRSKPKEKK